LTRPSTLRRRMLEDVDARIKSGHDDGTVETPVAHNMSESRPRPAVLSAAFLIGPASATVVLVLVLPLLLLLRYSFNRFVPGQFMVEALTLENYVKFFADPYYSRVMLVTGVVAVSSTSFCLVLGYPT